MNLKLLCFLTLAAIPLLTLAPTLAATADIVVEEVVQLITCCPLEDAYSLVLDSAEDIKGN